VEWKLRCWSQKVFQLWVLQTLSRQSLGSEGRKEDSEGSRTRSSLLKEISASSSQALSYYSLQPAGFLSFPSHPFLKHTQPSCELSNTHTSTVNGAKASLGYSLRKLS
jgi:hypothetical protein